MKRFLLALLMLMILCVLAVPMHVQAAETVPEGYTAVSTKEQLNAVRNNLGGKYYLTADIVFTDADFAVGGAFKNAPLFAEKRGIAVWSRG